MRLEDRIRKEQDPEQNPEPDPGPRYESEDPDPHPDQYQNVTDPEHWIQGFPIYKIYHFRRSQVPLT